jgi:hypothetical protein
MVFRDDTNRTADKWPARFLTLFSPARGLGSGVLSSQEASYFVNNKAVHGYYQEAELEIDTQNSRST